MTIDKQDCNSCEELESKLQAQWKEIELLQKQLNYWQNTTINILEKYPIDGKNNFTWRGALYSRNSIFSIIEPRTCASDRDSYIDGKLSLEDLSQQIQKIINQTQGIYAMLIIYEHR